MNSVTWCFESINSLTWCFELFNSLSLCFAFMNSLVWGFEFMNALGVGFEFMNSLIWALHSGNNLSLVWNPDINWPGGLNAWILNKMIQCAQWFQIFNSLIYGFEAMNSLIWGSNSSVLSFGFESISCFISSQTPNPTTKQKTRNPHTQHSQYVSPNATQTQTHKSQTPNTKTQN